MRAWRAEPAWDWIVKGSVNGNDILLVQCHPWLNRVTYRAAWRAAPTLSPDSQWHESLSRARSLLSRCARSREKHRTDHCVTPALLRSLPGRQSWWARDAQ